MVSLFLFSCFICFLPVFFSFHIINVWWKRPLYIYYCLRVWRQTEEEIIPQLLQVDSNSFSILYFFFQFVSVDVDAEAYKVINNFFAKSSFSFFLCTRSNFLFLLNQDDMSIHCGGGDNGAIEIFARMFSLNW